MTLGSLGRSEQALAAADEALSIGRALGRDREVAAGLGRIAAILRQAGRHAEAEARYHEAIGAAERVGNLVLQRAGMQHLGSLQRETGRAAAAVETLKAALRLFQQAGDQRGEMQTCTQIGNAELVLDRLAPAEAWYRKALALAEALSDQQQIGAIRQNLGILFQLRAEAVPSDATNPAHTGPRPDPADVPERQRWLAAAIAEIEASLTIKQQMSDQLGAAASHSQLSVLHRLRGDLDRAETEARQALAIWEPLDHPETWKVYANLADIARARGDTATADHWQAKAEAKQAEMQRRAHGHADDAEPTGLDLTDPRHRQLLDTPLALARAVFQARTAAQPLPPDAAEALAQLTQLPEPLPAYAAFLQALADGANPSPPPLPAPLARIAAALLNALS